MDINDIFSYLTPLIQNTTVLKIAQYKQEQIVFLKLAIIIVIILLIVTILLLFVLLTNKKEIQQDQECIQSDSPAPSAQYQSIICESSKSLSVESDACDCNDVKNCIESFTETKSDKILLQNRYDSFKNLVNYQLFVNKEDSDLVIYHYTDIASAKSILKDRLIFANQSVVPKFGKGVFLTTLPPTECDQRLIENNYLLMSDKHKPKIKCAFAFYRKDLKKLQRIYDSYHRNVYKNEDDINLNNYRFELIFRK